MKLIYIDEAGNTGKKADPDQPIHMIGFLIVDEFNIRTIELSIGKIAEKCAANLSAHDPLISADDIEFHGADIYSGSNKFKKISPSDRIKYCKEIIQSCSEAGAVFGYCAVDKIKLWSNLHPHMLCFQFVLERSQDYLRIENAMGLIVADEHRELEDTIVRDLAFSKTYNTGWGYRPTNIANIVDTVHFVKSHHNRLIQAVDVLTYFRLKALRLEQKLFESFRTSGSTDYAAYVDANTKPAEKAVLELRGAIQGFQRYEKLWP